MSITYPYPSHVCASNFVTMKLTGKDMYGLWKTQMLCLLESHGMLAFIDGTLVISPAETSCSNDDYTLWKRSDALVQGWIFGSLSEQAAMNVLDRLTSKLHQHMGVTAKDVWDQVRSMYGQQADRKGGASLQDSKPRKRPIDLKKEMEEVKDRGKNNQQLYFAAERGRWQEVDHILQKSQVKITDVISANGNTALHLAVLGTSHCLEKMLNLIPEIPLLEVRNSDGSTMLHIAASLGNIDTATILVDRSRELLFAKDNEGCTPLDILFSKPKHKEMCMYFLDAIMTDVEQGDTFADTRGEEPLVNAISYGHFDLAQTLLQRYNALKSDTVLMAIAQHWPPHFKLYESIIYELWQTPVVDFVTRGSVDIDNRKNFMDEGYITLPNLVLRVVFAWPFKKLIGIYIKLKVFKNFKEKVQRRQVAREVLDTVCGLIKFSNDPTSYPDFYRKPLLEAIRQDACDVVEQIVFWFPRAIMIVDEDGHNIAQSVWKNRALKVLALSLNADHMAKHTTISQKIKDDPCGNNFLNFAARLAPADKLNLISGPPFKLQRELRWFKAAKTALPASIMEKNCSGETPDMVFTREHKDLLIEGGKWMKNTVSAYIITATLIITIVFAAAITIPGGNDEKDGLPRLDDNPIFIIFAISIAL